MPEAAPQITRLPVDHPEAGEPPRAVPRRRLLAIGAVTIVVMAVLAVLGVTRWWPGADDVVGAAPPVVVTGTSGTPRAPVSARVVAPSPTATTKRPVQDDAAVVPTLAAVSTPGSRRSPSPTPADPIVAMRLSIRQQVDAGHLNPEKAADLYKKVDDIAHAINDGHQADAAKKVKEFRDKLTDLHHAGTLTTAGYDRLTTDLDRLADLLSLTEPPGPERP
jgi:serine/threonine-protein kinase